MDLVAFIASVVFAPYVAGWIARAAIMGWWPFAAFALRLGLHVAWTGILGEHGGVHDDLLLPLASGFGLLTIALISVLLLLVARRPPRREGVFGVLAPEPAEAGDEEVFAVLTAEPVELDKAPAPKLPRAQVVKRAGRRRHSAYRRSAPRTGTEK